MVEESLAR